MDKGEPVCEEVGAGYSGGIRGKGAVTGQCGACREGL